MKLSFVILTRNSENYINACIKSILASIPSEIDFDIHVVDNGSTDNTINMLATWDEVQVIKLPTNRGTTYSRNIALRNCDGDYIVIMDSDIEIVGINWHGIIETFLSGVGIVAPRLRYPDGIVQHSVKKFPTLHWRLNKLKTIFWGIKTTDMELYSSLDSVDFPDTAISAFWVLSKNAFDSIGFFDEIIFYSPEDIDYCARLWKKGFAIKYYKQANIIHHTQQIARKKPISLISLSFFVNFIYYFIKHGYFFNAKQLLTIKSQVLSKHNLKSSTSIPHSIDTLKEY